MKLFLVLIYLLLIIIGGYWLLWSSSSVLFIKDFIVNYKGYPTLPVESRLYLLSFWVVAALSSVFVNIFNLGIYTRAILGQKNYFGSRLSNIMGVVTFILLLLLAFNEIRVSHIQKSYQFDLAITGIYIVELLLLIHYFVRLKIKS